MMIRLSEKTQELIKQYNELSLTSDSQVLSCSSFIERQVLIQWLSERVLTPKITKKSPEDVEFILTSLRVELLRDLLISMKINPHELNKESPPAKLNRLKFYLIAISGTLLAACEGFDGISTLLSAFSLPSLATLLAGLVFSVLSVMVFYGLNLVQVSKSLGVKLTDTPKLLDLYLLQLNEIKCIRKKINTYKLSSYSSEELDNLVQVLSMLESQLDSIKKAGKQFAEALDSPQMTLIKRIFIGINATLFFGGGFFAGQSVGTFIAGLIIGGAVGSTFLPVTLFAVLVGVASLCLYWYVEKEGLEQVIGNWFGLDQEKVDELFDQEKLEHQAQKLSSLKEKILDTVKVTHQTAQLIEQTKELATASTVPNSLTASTNIYSFHKTGDSVSTCSSDVAEEELVRTVLTSS